MSKQFSGSVQNHAWEELKSEYFEQIQEALEIFSIQEPMVQP